MLKEKQLKSYFKSKRFTKKKRPIFGFDEEQFEGELSFFEEEDETDDLKNQYTYRTNNKANIVKIKTYTKNNINYKVLQFDNNITNFWQLFKIKNGIIKESFDDHVDFVLKEYNKK